MPIYEFECPECKDRFEEMRRMSQSSDPMPCKNGCKKGESVVECVKIISMTATPQTGDPERATKLIKDRNKDYWNSSNGKDELRNTKEKLAKKYGAL